jgi:hypothetical protein
MSPRSNIRLQRDSDLDSSEWFSLRRTSSAGFASAFEIHWAVYPLRIEMEHSRKTYFFPKGLKFAICGKALRRVFL